MSINFSKDQKYENENWNDITNILKRYYKENLDVGFSIEDVEYHLLKNGYREEDFKSISEEYKLKQYIKDKMIIVKNIIYFFILVGTFVLITIYGEDFKQYVYENIIWIMILHIPIYTILLFIVSSNLHIEYKFPKYAGSYRSPFTGIIYTIYNRKIIITTIMTIIIGPEMLPKNTPFAKFMINTLRITTFFLIIFNVVYIGEHINYIIKHL